MPTIKCGFRDSKGIVNKIDTIKTTSIPSQVKEKWNPWLCLNFTHSLLIWMRQHVVEENKSYLMRFDGGNQITLSPKEEKPSSPKTTAESKDEPVVTKENEV